MKQNVQEIRNWVKNDLDNVLVMWFKLQRSLNILLIGSLLKFQAEKLVTQLGYKEFTCTNGRLERFKNRNYIVYAKISRESDAANIEESDNKLQNVWLRM